MTVNTGIVKTLKAPARLPEAALIKGTPAEEERFQEWAEDKWHEQYQLQHAAALASGDTRTAWNICEQYDKKCLEQRV